MVTKKYIVDRKTSLALDTATCDTYNNSRHRTVSLLTTTACKRLMLRNATANDNVQQQSFRNKVCLKMSLRSLILLSSDRKRGIGYNCKLLPVSLMPLT